MIRALLLLVLVTASVANPLDDAYWRARCEVAYCRAQLASVGVVMADNHLYALSTLQYVTGRVSAPHYGYKAWQGQALPVCTGGPTSCAESSVILEAGVCGHAQAAFNTLMVRHVGVNNVRKVDAFFPGNNHTLTEIYFAGKWRAYDPTWGCYWREPGKGPWDLASASEVAAALAGDAWEVPALSLMWRQVTDVGGWGASSGRLWWAEPTLTIKTGSTILFQR